MQVEEWAADERAVNRSITLARQRLAGIGVLVVAVLGVVVVLVADHIAHDQAERDARSRAAVVAGVVGAATRTDGAPQGPLERAIADVAREQSVSHVVVWDSTGQVLWSEDPALVGRRFGLDEDLQDLFDASGGATMVGRPNRVDHEEAETPPQARSDFEVFTVSEGADGEPLVVESYVDAASLDEHRREMLWLLLPLALTALILVAATCVAGGTALMRQLRRTSGHTLRLTHEAISALENQRRELAHELHDGVVQDLAAMRYAITSIARELEPGPAGSPRDRLERVCELLEQELVDLRGTLGVLVPPDLETRTLEEALHSLVRHLVPHEMRCVVRVDCGALTPGEARVAYTIVREGLQNAVRHARASSLVVDLSYTGSGRRTRLVVRVDDDGRGPATPTGDLGSHYGLRLLQGMVREHGGSLELGACPDGGARLQAELPVTDAARPQGPGRPVGDHDDVAPVVRETTPSQLRV